MRFCCCCEQEINGTEQHVDFATCLSSYMAAESKIEFFDSWTSERPVDQESYVEHTIKAHITIALFSIAGEIKEPKLRIQTKPSRAVFADAAYGVGKLILVPESTKIGAVSDQSDCPPSALKCVLPADSNIQKSFFCCPNSVIVLRCLRGLFALLTTHLSAIWRYNRSRLSSQRLATVASRISIRCR